MTKHDWPMVPLGDLLVPAKNVRAGQGEYPVLSITMHDGLVFQDSRFKKRIAGKDLTSYKVVKRNQLVVGFPIDEAVLDFQTICDEGIVSPAYGVWDLKQPEITEIDYLRRFLKSEIAIQHYKSRLKGTTARRRSLTRQAFESIELPFPPFDEQRRIAGILDFNQLCVKHVKEKIALFEELTNSILDFAIENAPEWVRIEKIGSLNGGLSLGGSRKTFAHSAPYLRVANVYRNHLDLAEIKEIPVREGELEKADLLQGDILLVEGHGNTEDVGRCCLVDRDLEGYTFQNHLFRLRVENDQFDPFLVSRVINSTAVRARMRKLVTTTSGLKTTSISKIRSLQIPRFTVETSQELLGQLNGIEYLAEIERQKLLTLEELQKSLASRAFRGEL